VATQWWCRWPGGGRLDDRAPAPRLGRRDRYTNAALPFVDATVAAASVAAQFMLSFRKIENWVLWIAIDVVSIGLYINRGLLLTAGLYVLLLGLSALGLKDWMAAEREGRPA